MNNTHSMVKWYYNKFIFYVAEYLQQYNNIKKNYTNNTEPSTV